MKDEEARLNTGLGFVGYFLGIDAFLLGILIANYSQFALRFRIPIFFLVCSLMGFIMAARLYRDASGASVYGSKIGLTTGKMHELGNIISELIGLNMLIFAIPLIISLLISDSFITYSTGIIVSVMFGLYMSTQYTILARRYQPPVRVPLAVIMSASLIASALLSNTRYFYLCFVPFGVSVVLCIHSMLFLRYKKI